MWSCDVIESSRVGSSWVDLDRIRSDQIRSDQDRSRLRWRSWLIEGRIEWNAMGGWRGWRLLHHHTFMSSNFV